MGSFKNVGYFSSWKVLQYRPGARGSKRAAVAIGHQILKDVYRILSTGEPYKEVGARSCSKPKV